MRIVLAGASGLIGTALRDSLRDDGHTVVSLVRHAPTAGDERRWEPAAGELDPAVLDGAEAVVCLSGANVGGRRWTSAYKRQIRESRVRSVATLARAVAGHGGVPAFVAASAVGYYGDAGDRVVTEADPAGDTFLARVCVDWEAAADPARSAGVRVVHLRSGLVLAPEAELVKRLRPLVQAGVGGRLGSGRQYWPWISLADEIGAIRYLLTHDIAGPANLTGPGPVRQEEFVAAMGRALGRPTVVPTPAFALRAALGEFAGEILIGQQAVPQVLLDAGFSFRHSDLDAALRWTLR